jgi:hypothetical protein
MTAAVAATILTGLLAGCSAPGSDGKATDNPAPTSSSGTAAKAATAGPSAAGSADAATGTPEPQATTSAASEVPPGSSNQPATTLPPPQVPTQAHLTLPLPPAASAQGKVVAGFPVDIVPVSPDSVVVATSVTGQGDRLQIALQSTSATPPVDVLAFYRTKLAGLGFLEEATPAADGTVAANFIRGGDGLVVSVRTALGGGSQTSVAGALQAVG